MNLIESTITENLKDQNTIFVFPTGTSGNLWADYIVQNGRIKCVASQRFIAWDNFKSEAIKCKVQGKSSIPGVMRKVFATNLIEENKNQPFLKRIILEKYKDSSQSFANWISGLLPQLQSWKKTTANISDFDEEDQDYESIYKKYSDFLDEHNFFDPAWEKPPFTPNGNKYIIFFPEILQDFAEYQELLQNTPHIQLINLPKTGGSVLPEETKPVCNFYPDSRSELKSLCMEIKRCHEEENVPYSQMAVSVSDMDIYKPYLLRDFDFFQIPIVIKSGQNLGNYRAGGLFNQILECTKSNFSFEGVKALVMNNELPWKNRDLLNTLIQFGKAENCMCAFEENDVLIDPWEYSFKNVNWKDKKTPGGVNLIDFYRNFKHQIKGIAECKTFGDINRKWFELRQDLFEEENFQPYTDMILSRCISELSKLIDLELKYKDFKVPDPFAFFVEILKDTDYVPQNKEFGVQVYPYKTVSSAPFQKHFVIDSCQKSLSITYTPLSFLREDKRRKLGLEEINPSDSFIALYQMNSIKPVSFSASSKNFEGFAICYSGLKMEKTSSKINNLNFLDSEKKFFTPGSGSAFPERISTAQKIGFEQWCKNQRSLCSEQAESQGLENWQEILKNSTLQFSGKGKKENNQFEGKIIISQSSLKSFFKCPKSFYFEKVCGLGSVNNTTELTSNFTMGSIFHKILEEFGNICIEENVYFTEQQNTLNETFQDIFNRGFERSLTLESIDVSPIARKILQSQGLQIKLAIEGAIIALLNKFPGYTFLATEKWYNYAPKDKDFAYTGQIDCLLTNPEGNIVLLDYKSSKSSIPGTNELFGKDDYIPDFQMPTYFILMNNQKKPVCPDRAFFFDLKEKKFIQFNGEKAKSAKITPLTEDEVQNICSKTEQYVQIYVDAIKNGKFNSLNPFDWETCAQCDYKAICRKTFTVCPSGRV